MDLEFRFGEMFYAVAVIAVGRLLLSLTGAGLARPVFFATATLSVLLLIDAWLELLPIEWPALCWFTWLAATIIAIRAWVVMRQSAAAGGAVRRGKGGPPHAPG